VEAVSNMTAAEDALRQARTCPAVVPLPPDSRPGDPSAAAAGDLPVADVGRVSACALHASSLIATDAFGLARLRDAIRTARSVDDLAKKVVAMPTLFVELVDAGLQAPTLTRVYTALGDAVTSRLIELNITRRGTPPVAFAWLAFGSAGRHELSLFSDQDNGLAYEDTRDPSVDEYFLQLAIDVNDGLSRCGFPLDPHGVLATGREWRMQASDWVALFADCLRCWDGERLLRAAICFDVRQVAGDLWIVPRLDAVISRAPGYSRFLSGLAELGAEISSPLRFPRRLKGPVDLKWRGLLVVQNLARYYACAAGLTPSSTVDRLAAVREAGAKGSDVAEALREAYVTMAGLQSRHQAEILRRGGSPDEPLDTARLDPESRASLQQALRQLASVQERLPRRVAL
jgi:CBS domain-containing protein